LKVHPAVRLVVTTGTTRKLLQDVLDCRLEGAFVAGPVNHPELHHQPIFREELVLVTSRTVRTPQELTDIPDLKTIVFQTGCSYRQRLEALLAGMGVITTKPLEFGSLEAILSCVSAGIGVTLLPRGVVANACQEGEVAMHELASEISQVETVFVRRADSYVSSAMTAFLNLARSRS
jgi:DNA-binding transcriptional LysR family regulator